MPMPPAMSNARGRRRRSDGEDPVGTLDDHSGARPEAAQHAVKSPTSFTVMRRYSPLGAAESEKGGPATRFPDPGSGT